MTDQAETRPQMIIGSDNYPPFNYEDADGKPAGIDVDLATEAFDRLGYDAVFTYIDWEAKSSFWKTEILTASGEVFLLMAEKISTTGRHPI